MSLRTCPPVHKTVVAALVAGSLAAAPPEAPRPPTVLLGSLAAPSDGPLPASVPVPLSDAPRPAGSTAAPDPSAPKLAIAPIGLDGTGDPLLAQQLEQDLRGGMQRGRLQVLDAADVARVAGGACGDAACVERLQKELGAAFVLRTRVAVVDRDYTLRLELVSTKNRETAAESERVCELCGLAELRALTADQAARLLASLDALAKPPPGLEVTTRPPGALVFIDEQLVGVSPVERTLLEGKHVVRVMSEGYVPEERPVVAVAGVRDNLQIDLRRTPETLKLRSAGWGLLGAGVPLAIGAVALLALDGRPFKGLCEDEYIDYKGNCRYVFNTDWGGAGLLAAGTLLATAGAMLLLRTRDRTRAPKKVRAHLTPTGLGLSGRF